MQKIEKLLQKRAAELLAEGTVERVLAGRRILLR